MLYVRVGYVSVGYGGVGFGVLACGVDHMVGGLTCVVVACSHWFSGESSPVVKG